MASLDYDLEKTAFREFYEDNRDNIFGAMESFKTLIVSLLLSDKSIAISEVIGRVKDK